MGAQDDPRFAAIDGMSGTEFEAAIAELFERAGYSVERLGGYTDLGADLIATADDERMAVQTKRWSRPVGIGAVRALVDGLHRHGCTRGVVVTNNFFTEQAVGCARGWDVELWDRRKLAEYLERDAPAVDWNRCAECDEAVSDGIRDYCLNRPARFSGRVYSIEHQRRDARGVG